MSKKNDKIYLFNDIGSNDTLIYLNGHIVSSGDVYLKGNSEIAKNFNSKELVSANKEVKQELAIFLDSIKKEANKNKINYETPYGDINPRSDNDNTLNNFNEIFFRSIGTNPPITEIDANWNKVPITRQDFEKELNRLDSDGNFQWERATLKSISALNLILVLRVSEKNRGFKLPHYLNIVFPVSSVFTAAFIISKSQQTGWIKRIFTIQFIITLILLLLAVIINGWAFLVKNFFVITIVVLMLAAVFYFINSNLYNRLQKAISFSVVAMALCFFLLNSNFYPRLLTYQGGNELAFMTKGKVNPARVYFWSGTQSSSYNFYTATLRRPFVDSILRPGEKTWLLFDIRNEDEIKQVGYQLGEQYSVYDYEITRLDIKFVNPEKRDQQSTRMVLAEIGK